MLRLGHIEKPEDYGRARKGCETQRCLRCLDGLRPASFGKIRLVSEYIISHIFSEIVYSIEDVARALKFVGCSSSVGEPPKPVGIESRLRCHSVTWFKRAVYFETVGTVMDDSKGWRLVHFCDLLGRWLQMG